MIFLPILRLFERWIDPFAPRADYEPPNRLLAYVWHYVGQARWAFAALLVYGFINAIVEAALFAFMGDLVDMLGAFAEAGRREEGWAGLMASHGPTLLMMVFVVAIGRALVIAFGALIEEQVIVPGFFTLMRWQSHKHVVAQSLTFFQNDLAGRIAAKVQQSGHAAGEMMIALLQVIWFIAVYGVTTLGLLTALDWRLGAVVAVWIAAFVAIAWFFIPRIRWHGRNTAEAASVASGRMVDGYSNITTVKLYGHDSREEDWVRDAYVAQYTALRDFTRALTGVRVTLSTVSGLMIAIIAWLAVDLWLAESMSLGAVAFSLALVLRLNLLMGRLMGNLNGFFRAMGTVQNTMEMVAKPLGLVDARDAGPLRFDQGRMEFRNVDFDYGRVETGDEGPVIDDFSLTIEPGERVGLVGPSGAGKSTLVNLLLRFHDPERGKILIDGQDIATVTQESLRANFSIVQQEVALFHRSVGENIAYGRVGASDEEIEAAAAKARADAFIANLEDARGRRGYEARIGERGVKLSGGQRQRIAIARVFARDAPILILDEATAQLDSEVEAVIQENLFELMKGKTVIAIAHRLSTLSAMDRLVVIDAGRIVEQGRHAELIEAGGLYARLWALQARVDETA